MLKHDLLLSSKVNRLFTHTITIGSYNRGSRDQYIGYSNQLSDSGAIFGAITPSIVDNNDALVIIEFVTLFSRRENDSCARFAIDQGSDYEIYYPRYFYFGRLDTMQNFGRLTNTDENPNLDGTVLFTEADIGKTIKIWLSITTPCPF